MAPQQRQMNVGACARIDPLQVGSASPLPRERFSPPPLTAVDFRSA